MTIQAIGTKVISTLGNKESLIPLMIKDGVDSTCLTVKSFKEGGAIEGKDRFIDEFGTQAIWIGGIPLFKKIIDSTIYKAAKISPEIDTRILQSQEYSKWALENAKGDLPATFGNKIKANFNNIISKTKKLPKTQSVKDALTNCLADGGKKTKNLMVAKVIGATALTMATFFTLTKYKHNKTKKSALEDMPKQVKSPNYNAILVNNNTSSTFASLTSKFSNNSPKTSFKGANIIEKIMFNPVNNMKIIDGAITTERLACSRNKHEFMEHAIKEGSFLFFLYGFGNIIESGINKASSKFLKKPIDLTIDTLMDTNLTKALSEGKVLADISKLPTKGKSLTEKLNFIINNPDNIVVQAAKKSKVISTVKDKAGNVFVDTSKFIDMDAFDKVAQNLKNLDDKFKISGSTAEKFMNKCKAMKVTSVVANIGISCLFLGFLVPKAIYKYREKSTGTTQFHVVNDIQKEKSKASA